MKIGVFDIGTRAIRLLIGDSENLNYRKNFGLLTWLGEGFDAEGKLNWDKIIKTFDVMRDFLIEGEKEGVEVYITVATAALRKAKNRDQFVNAIRDLFGLEVIILNDEEEAYLSLLSAFCHFQNQIEEGQPIILIDQGGGSTEISCGELLASRFHFRGLISLDLGSLKLKKMFLSKPELTVFESYLYILRYIEETIAQQKEFPELQGRNPTQAFGMGSAITNITGVKGNRKQHGRVITLERMNYILNSRLSSYKQSNVKLGKLIEDAKKYGHYEDLERELLSIYGLPVYQHLLKSFHLDRLTVCGYGLRYGVFLYHVLPDLVEREIQLPLTPRSEIKVPPLDIRSVLKVDEY